MRRAIAVSSILRRATVSQPAWISALYTAYRSATRRFAGSCLATRNHISTSDTRMMT